MNRKTAGSAGAVRFPPRSPDVVVDVWGYEEMQDEPALQTRSNVPQCKRISTLSIERLIPPPPDRGA
jgi:hypothetical protein